MDTLTLQTDKNIHQDNIDTKNCDREKESRLAFLLAVMNGNTDCVKHLMEAGLTGTVNDQNLDLGTAVVLAIRKCRFDCLRYLTYIMRNSGDEFEQVINAIDIAEKESLNRYSGLEDFKTTLSKFLPRNITKRDITGLDTLEAVDELYDQLYSGRGMIHTMIWCSATVLCIPSQCIYCLCETNESNTAMFEGCIETAIGLAVVNSHLDCVKRLLGNSQTTRLETTTLGLVVAACTGSVECLKYLLETTVFNAVDRRQRTMNNTFLLAAFYAHIDCVKYLLDIGQIDINECKINGNTALMLMAKEGHIDCVKYLFDTGHIDVNKSSYSVNDAFKLSAKEGHIDCVKYLLDTGHVDVDGYILRNALGLSAMGGHIDCVKYLLTTWHIDINDRLMSGNTALMLSAMGGHVACINYLLKFGIGQQNINVRNKDDRNIFMLLAMAGHVDGVKYLLNTGLVKNINHLDNKSDNAFSLSAGGGHIECVKYLLEFGFKPSNGDINFSIRNAVKHERPECLDLLFEFIPYEHRTRHQMKAMFMADSRPFRPHIPFFLKAGAFHWSWYPEFYDERASHNDSHLDFYDERILAHDLVLGGYAPREFKWKGKTSSPLHNSLMNNDEGLARYLIVNLYLTPFDVEHFLNGENLMDRGNWNVSESFKELYRQICTTPWRLEVVCLLKISSLLRNERREKDMEKLDGLLPGYFQRLLGFKSPFRRFCRRKWHRIDGNYMFLLNGGRAIQLEERNFVRTGCCRDFCLQFL